MRDEDAAVADLTDQGAEGLLVTLSRPIHECSQHPLPPGRRRRSAPSTSMSLRARPNSFDPGGSQERIMLARAAKGVIDMDQKNLDIYGNEPIPWSRPLAELEKFVAGPGSSVWVATTRPDGRPHVAGVGAIWLDGRF